MSTRKVIKAFRRMGMTYGTTAISKHSDTPGSSKDANVTMMKEAKKCVKGISIKKLKQTGKEKNKEYKTKRRKKHIIPKVAPNQSLIHEFYSVAPRNNQSFAGMKEETSTSENMATKNSNQ